MAHQRYQRQTIDCSKIRPHAKELVDRCGSCEAAGAYAGIGKSTFFRILNSYNCSVQQATARKILLALERRREEDRRNHSVNERLLEAKNRQARIEDNQERLAGY